jgi:hypothetical protein
MIQSSEHRIDEIIPQEQQMTQPTSAPQHQDPNHAFLANEPAQVTGQMVPSEMLNPHAEAGRKGARRIHELIQEGRLYEREHGLKPGRQRLRQLIQEGKLYEQEHGLRNGNGGVRARRHPRISSEQLLKSLFQTLLRLVKPVYRAQILGMLQSLEPEVK